MNPFFLYLTPITILGNSLLLPVIILIFLAIVNGKDVCKEVPRLKLNVLRLGFNLVTIPEVQVSGVEFEGRHGTSTEILNTDVYRNFAYSPLATEILWSKPSGGQNSVELIYHGDESYGNFFISSV